MGSLMVSVLIAHAQDATAPAAASPEPQTSAPAAQVADASTPAQPAPAVEAQPAAAAPAQVVESPAEATNAQPAAVEAPAAAPTSVIPLIVIDDTPLLDAIRNLARQAGINLMIDPRVAYGQPDPTKPGTVVAQPNVSIRWENITAEQALNALLSNYGLQAVQDPKVNITRVTIKDPAAPDPLVTKTIQLQYSSPSNVLGAVTASFTDKRSKAVADVRTSQLVIVATEKEHVELEKLVSKLDSPTKQVLIEARLVETTFNPKTMKGVDWSQTLGSTAAGVGQGQTINFGNTPLNTIHMDDLAGGFKFNPGAAFLDANGLSATLSFLNASTEAKILSTPRTVTLDNETAHIEAGTLYPIVNVTAGTSQTAGGSQVNYSNLTVRLDVTPRISANNLINLRVTPSIMRLVEVKTFAAGSSSEGASSFDVPIFATRNFNTSVMIPSGNTLVMGGLVEDNATENATKVPVLGDIPVLGKALFHQNSKSREKRNLIVFITPTIVQDTDFQPTSTEYLKTPVSSADNPNPEWDWWDSAKPKDWSKGN